MRLFVAADVGEQVRGAAALLIGELRGRVERLAPAARVTWVAPDQMHLTVRFIGEVREDDVGTVLHALRGPIPAEPFSVSWSGLGAFPASGSPRVLWAAAGEGSASLELVHREVNRRLAALHVPSDDGRPYRAHLTLARVRDPRGLRTAPIFEGVPARLGQTRVEAITLFESRLSSKGATHVALQRTPLRAS